MCTTEKKNIWRKRNHKHRAVDQTLPSRKYWDLILVFFMLLGWVSKFLFGQNSHSCLSLDFCLAEVTRVCHFVHQPGFLLSHTNFKPLASAELFLVHIIECERADPLDYTFYLLNVNVTLSLFKKLQLMKLRKFIDGLGKSFCPNLLFCLLLIVIESIKTTELGKEVEERKHRTAGKSIFPLRTKHAGTRAQKTEAHWWNILHGTLLVRVEKMRHGKSCFNFHNNREKTTFLNYLKKCDNT